MKTLKFAQSSSKIHALATHLKSVGKIKYINQVWSLDLPAGHTCPWANICKAKLNYETGTVIKGKNAKFLCYAVKAETLYPSVKELRLHNFNLIKQCKNSEQVYTLLQNSLPKNISVLRISSSGDIFKQSYFDGLVKLAQTNPDLIMFGYTKNIEYVKASKPNNFKLVYSYGGTLDYLHDNSIPTCYVITDQRDFKYPVLCESDDYSDYYAILDQQSFGLMVH